MTDASGAAVPGVTIQVKNVNTGVTRTVFTNEQGRYRVPDLLVGEYEVQDQIGEGAMGTVFSAVHPLIGKKVAIKVLKPELCANQGGASARVWCTDLRHDAGR